MGKSYDDDPTSPTSLQIQVFVLALLDWFKTQTLAHISQTYRREMMFWKPNKPFLIVMRFHFHELENSGFPTGKAKDAPTG